MQVVKRLSWPPAWNTGKGVGNPWVGCAGPIGPGFIPVIVLTYVSLSVLKVLDCAKLRVGFLGTLAEIGPHL